MDIVLYLQVWYIVHMIVKKIEKKPHCKTCKCFKIKEKRKRCSKCGAKKYLKYLKEIRISSWRTELCCNNENNCKKNINYK